MDEILAVNKIVARELIVIASLLYLAGGLIIPPLICATIATALTDQPRKISENVELLHLNHIHQPIPQSSFFSTICTASLLSLIAPFN